MEAHAAEASKAVDSARQKLQNALKQPEPDYAIYEPLLEKLRVRSGNLALLKLTTDQAADQIEQRLWGFHTEVNNKFRTHLKSYRDGSGKKKHVERRKAEKLYVEFIKGSQRFYRAYIERLTANFTNIPKVLEIARKLSKESLTVQAQKTANDEQRQILESSCKRCIIYLGDLSRWRETELTQKERNWGPAKGYYNLALSLDPAEGACYNQLALIAVRAEDHIGAVYNLHRAFAVTPPFPTANDNLNKEFEKVFKLNIEETYGMMDRSGDDMLSTLAKRFLAFHAHCYSKPYDFVAFQQRANDILHMVTIGFEDQDTNVAAFDHFLGRACLINVTAEHISKRGMEGDVVTRELLSGKPVKEIEKHCQSFFLLQRFNLMTFQSLLRVLARELGDIAPDGTDVTDMSRLTSTTRRVLPHLRQYSSWFLSNMRSLVQTKYKSSRKLLEQVSKTYAQALNLLRGNVDVFAAPYIPHLLEEDLKTLSFSPFSPVVYKWRYQGTDDNLKPRRPENIQGRELQEELRETHVRATELVVDALRLIKHQDDLEIADITISVVLKDGQFDQQDIPEASLPVPPPSPPAKKWRGRVHVHASSVNGVIAPEDRSQTATPIASRPATANPEVHEAKSGTETNGAVESQSGTVKNLEPSTLEAMPASLNSSGLITGTPAVSAVSGMTAMDLVRQMQRSTAGSGASQRSPESGKVFVQPSLPSVYNTAFAPTWSEKAQLSPRLETSHQRSPILSPPELNSSALFHDQLARQQREVQMRSTPQPGFQPPPSWDSNFGQTPTGMDSMFRAFEKQQGRTPSPFVSPQVQSSGRSPSGRSSNVPQQAPFGVIGQARPVSRGTPTSGQG